MYAVVKALLFLARPLAWLFASYLVLSVPVGGRPVFDHVHAVVGPWVARTVQDGVDRQALGEVLEDALGRSSDAAGRLFSNTLPKGPGTGPPRGGATGEGADADVDSARGEPGRPGEPYAAEERELLERILERARRERGR